jgi:para-aminobenzoate synthetase
VEPRAGKPRPHRSDTGAGQSRAANGDAAKIVATLNDGPTMPLVRCGKNAVYKWRPVLHGRAMRTLVIDNHDSFTHNLVHLLAVVNQESPIVIRNDELGWNDVKDADFDNVVLSPGPGHPEREQDFGLCRRFIEACDKPILGVCLGHQGIAAAFGGRVARAPVPVHGKTSVIRHSGTALFRGVPFPFVAARYHSLVACRPLPEDLVELAWSDDNLVMALAHRTRPLWGVQFHPESIITEHGELILRNFRDLSSAHSGDGRGVGFLAPRVRGKAGEGGRPPVPSRPVGTLRSLQGAHAGEGTCPTRLRAVWKKIDNPPDAEAAFAQMFAVAGHAFWLDSSVLERGRAHWSYFGAAADNGTAADLYDCSAKLTTFIREQRSTQEPRSILDYLWSRLGADVANPPPCPFVGGWVGWFGYEMGREFGGATRGKSPMPDAVLLPVDRFVAVNHDTGAMYLVCLADGSNDAASDAWIAETERRIATVTVPLDAPAAPSGPRVTFRLDRDRATYLRDIAQCLEWIRAGETYQVCLTNEITTELDIDPFALYRVLRRINPAPYAAYMTWPGGAVLSASPERFLQVDRGGSVEAKPIKGTIRRDPDPARDGVLARTLAGNGKDRAENVMIVDLLRNDLSRVCRPGSVTVPKLFAVESFATVHQLVSTVRGELAAGKNVIDLLRAAFPGGSMTGAPKIRTLELIDQLERRSRGVYSGALGWIGRDGAADLSIVIRTIVQRGRHLSLSVGGGIVAQSTPEGEFDEMLLKAKASIRAIVTAATGAFDDYVVQGAETAGEFGGDAGSTARHGNGHDTELGAGMAEWPTDGSDGGAYRAHRPRFPAGRRRV